MREGRRFRKSQLKCYLCQRVSTLMLIDSLSSKWEVSGSKGGGDSWWLDDSWPGRSHQGQCAEPQIEAFPGRTQNGNFQANIRTDGSGVIFVITWWDSSPVGKEIWPGPGFTCSWISKFKSDPVRRRWRDSSGCPSMQKLIPVACLRAAETWSQAISHE